MGRWTGQQRRVYRCGSGREEASVTTTRTTVLRRPPLSLRPASTSRKPCHHAQTKARAATAPLPPSLLTAAHRRPLAPSTRERRAPCGVANSPVRRRQRTGCRGRGGQRRGGGGRAAAYFSQHPHAQVDPQNSTHADTRTHTRTTAPSPHNEVRVWDAERGSEGEGLQGVAMTRQTANNTKRKVKISRAHEELREHANQLAAQTRRLVEPHREKRERNKTRRKTPKTQEKGPVTNDMATRANRRRCRRSR